LFCQYYLYLFIAEKNEIDEMR